MTALSVNDIVTVTNVKKIITVKSQKGDAALNSDFCVAVHGLVYLKHKGSVIPSEELASNICTNPARVRKVMARLKKAGLVETKEGKVGGYSRVEKAGDITLYTIAEALSIRFVDASWRSGDSDMSCLIASGMAEVMNGIYLELDGLCLDKLKQITVGEIETQLFSGKRKGEAQ